MIEVKGEVDRQEVAYEIAERSGISPVEALEALKYMGSVIADYLAVYQRAEIHGLGTFSLERRAPRHGKTPDGAEWETPERLEIVFEAWPTVAQIVAERTGVPTY